MTAGHECYHCKQWVEPGEAHDCWTTTESALTADLSDDLREAWERLRDTAADFGGQRIYASHNAIMFSRTSCYFFVRPRKTFLEVCVFLGRTVKRRGRDFFPQVSTDRCQTSGSRSGTFLWKPVEKSPVPYTRPLTTGTIQAAYRRGFRMSAII